VAVGDFNGDGQLDLAVANYGDGTVSIRLGDGTGGFNGATNVPVGSGPYGVGLGDFNGDGHLDLAVANSTTNTVSIRLGNGQGGFAVQPDVPVGTLPLSVAVADFNSDGKPDLGVAIYSGNSVSVLLNTFPGPLPPPAAPAPQFTAHVLRKKGKYLVTVTDAATGAVRLSRKFPFRVQLLRRDVNGDGLFDVIFRFRLNGKRRQLLFSGRDLSPLPANLAVG
jgi:hypothetical protein